MFCVTCQNDVAYCTCEDIDERLDELQRTQNFLMLWCPKCNKHSDRCGCPRAEA